MNNYFNYFTEVEEHFSRKRGKNLLVSPLDWCLIEVWRENSIPLHVALRGIDQSFETAQRSQKRAPRSLFYCHPAVLEAFEAHNRAMLGASDESTEESLPQVVGEFSREAVLDYIHLLEDRLQENSGEAFRRATARLAALRKESSSGSKMNFQQVDRDLIQVGTMLAEALREEISRDRLKELRKLVREETRIYRKRLDKDVYTRLEENYLNRKIHALYRLPEFSLLGME